MLLKFEHPKIVFDEHLCKLIYISLSIYQFSSTDTLNAIFCSGQAAHSGFIVQLPTAGI